MPKSNIDMYELCCELFPICRSLTGNGVRQTLTSLKKIIPQLMIHEVPTGTKVFDWTIPNEWNINDAFIADMQGKRIVDFKTSNLHVMGYSIPVNKIMKMTDINKHIYSLPDQPQAVPYITSYYKKRWGFCIADTLRKKLLKKPELKYHVNIDSTLAPGSLSYAELILPGCTDKEVLLSTYICHPSMANNEISGPVVLTELAKWLLSLTSRRYTYRIVFLPETIGSITYISRNLDSLQQNVEAGFVITCVGDNRTYSYLASRNGNTLADRVAKHVLKHHYPEYISYSFLDRGSDERQYCSPGVDLPVCSIMRSKYAEYPEYHTSLDDLSIISPEGLEGSLSVYKKCLSLLENNKLMVNNVKCEPQLGPRGLYPTLSTKNSGIAVRNMMNFLAYSDGKYDLIAIADLINTPASELIPIIKKLTDAGLITSVPT